MLMSFLAMSQPGGSSSGGGGGIAAFLPMILIFVILYFLILRPQSKRQREHQKMLDQLTKGDKIVTTGGVHGSIVRVNDEDKTLIVKVSDEIKLTIDRGAVARKISSEG